MSTCNWLDLQTLGSQPIMSKKLPDHCTECRGLDHIFIQLEPAPHTPPSQRGLLAHTCVGTLPRWEPI